MSRDRTGDLVAAAETYRESLPHADRAELRLEIALSVADCLRRAGRADESVAECDRIARETGTEDARLFAVRGLALAAQGKTALAVESLAEAVSRKPGEATFERWLERAEAGDRFEPPLPPPESKDPLR